MELPDLSVIHEPYPLPPEFRRDWERLYPRAIGANVFTSLERDHLLLSFPGCKKEFVSRVVVGENRRRSGL